MDPGAGIITAIDTLEADFVILVGIGWIIIDKLKNRGK